MDRIFGMLVRRLMRRGINAGIKRVTDTGKAREVMSPAERREARQSAKRARQAARMMRRLR